MHEIQRRILELATVDGLDGLSYRQIASRTGGAHASQVKHHLGQLIKQGRLMRNSNGQLFVTGSARPHAMNVVSIPVLGEADCGEATRFASDDVQGYLSISPSLVDVSYKKWPLFALKARGDSMNRSYVGPSKKPIEDGDYVLVRRPEPGEQPDGKYVVSVIHGLANIKKWRIDKTNRRVVLLPESSFPHFEPIIIAEEDLSGYQVTGVVVDVIKGVGQPAY